MEEYKYTALTQKIIGCAMRVHGELGAGFPEIVYQRSLAIEMRHANLLFEPEVYLPLYYRDESVGSRRADFLVEKTVLLELKATSELTPTHHAQIINYLNAYRIEVGLLLNFGESSLRFKRFIKTHAQSFSLISPPPNDSPLNLLLAIAGKENDPLSKKNESSESAASAPSAPSAIIGC